MKTYFEQRYPVSLLVRVTWSDGSSHVDEVKGLNSGHALSRARWNWPGAPLIVGLASYKVEV